VFVLNDEAVMVEFTVIVLTVKELPVNVVNRILAAVKLFPTVRF